MRGAIIGAVLVAAVAVGGWLGAESLASRQLAAAIAADPALDAAEIRPLRDPARLGVALRDVRLEDPAMGLRLPWAALSLRPLSPLTARLDLPETATLIQEGQERQLGLSDPVAWVALAPLNGFSPRAMQVSARGLTLDGQPLAGGLSLDADLVPLGAQAPRAARAAYDVTLALEEGQTAALESLGLGAGLLPGPVAGSGTVRLWLDGTPAPNAPAPQVVGWQTPGLEIAAGGIGLRLVGRLARDAQGRAEGQVALYSADSQAMIDMAGALGLIPDGARLLIRAGLSRLSEAPIDTALPGPAFPDPAEGELRLPVIFRDGQVVLGGLPIGPAPAF
ncbi:DUF2125 domain-containing protein [Paracoccus sp. ME4]|uniref:DUF2125 domain-containing protein n=1 Tax=Paracoccus sp. ME4 TaxID=3138066 RepID=UPI00398A59A7